MCAVCFFHFFIPIFELIVSIVVILDLFHPINHQRTQLNIMYLSIKIRFIQLWIHMKEVSSHTHTLLISLLSFRREKNNWYYALTFSGYGIYSAILKSETESMLFKSNTTNNYNELLEEIKFIGKLINRTCVCVRNGEWNTEMTLKFSSKIVFFFCCRWYEREKSIFRSHLPNNDIYIVFGCWWCTVWWSGCNIFQWFSVPTASKIR